MDVPSTPKRSQLTRDQRIQVQTLSGVGWDAERIAKHLKITTRQVRYATSHQLTPQNRKSGPKPVINTPCRDRLVRFIQSSKETRRMQYEEVATRLGWNVSGRAIRRALKKEGFSRHIARRKPPISEANRVARLQWAREHIDWTREQWETILWTDETWVLPGKHTRIWVTRAAGEEWDPTCIIEKIPRKQGWMFWGSFHGGIKGPGVFWEKDWGTINQTTYRERIVPVIHGWIRMHPHLSLMQDGAPGHAARATIEDLHERGINVIWWPAFSPDLNPIETVWNNMKDWIQDNYPEKLSYDGLRSAVAAAWEQISSEFLSDLLDSMQARCEAVIRANGMHTEY
jgi:transposase